MGWRDRDWAKFDDDEWRAFLGAGGQRYSATSSTPVTSPSSTPHPAAVIGPLKARARRSRSAGAVVVVAALVSFGATVGVDAFHRVANDVRATSPAAPSPNVVRIRWRPGDVAPAQTAGRICVDDARLGEVCADYVAGEKPADVLTRHLQSLGASVQSG